MKLNYHLKALLLLFAEYYPPPVTQTPSGLRASVKATRVPEDSLSDAVIEDIKARCCYVAEPLSSNASRAIVPSGSSSPHALPPSSSDPPSSDFDVDQDMDPEPTDPHIKSIEQVYRPHSRATELRIRINPPQNLDNGSGLATLVIPGWIRERAAEILFADGDLDEESVVEVILRSLRKV
jgi:actin-related protein 10